MKNGRYFLNMNYTKERNNTKDVECWYKNNLIHRDNDLPAIIHSHGLKCWYKNNKKHREYAPAEMTNKRRYRWFINGKNITNEVREWIKENNYPNYIKWSYIIKIQWKLRFL